MVDVALLALHTSVAEEEELAEAVVETVQVAIAAFLAGKLEA